MAQLLEDTVWVIEKIFVSDMEDSKVVLGKGLVASQIILAVLRDRVNAAIYLDDDTVLDTGKIGDVGAQGVLATKLQVIEAPGTQSGPDERFAGGRIDSKITA